MLPCSPTQEALYGGERVSSCERHAAQVYTRVDADANGILTPHEFGEVLGPLGLSSPELTAAFFRAADASRSGEVRLSDFVQWMCTMKYGSTKSKLQMGYRMLDSNGDGAITHAEMERIVTLLYRGLTGLSDMSSGGVELSGRGERLVSVQFWLIVAYAALHFVLGTEFELARGLGGGGFRVAGDAGLRW